MNKAILSKCNNLFKIACGVMMVFLLSNISYAEDYNTQNLTSENNMIQSNQYNTDSTTTNAKPVDGLFMYFDLSDIGINAISCQVTTTITNGANYGTFSPQTPITYQNGAVLFTAQTFLKRVCATGTTCSLVVYFQKCTNLDGSQSYIPMNSVRSTVVFPLSRKNSSYGDYLYNGTNNLPHLDFISNESSNTSASQ